MDIYQRCPFTKPPWNVHLGYQNHLGREIHDELLREMPIWHAYETHLGQLPPILTRNAKTGNGGPIIS